jgi:hypothetical protein
MAFDNFEWNKEEGSISWTFQGESQTHKIRNLYYAALNLEQNYVYLETGKNYNQDEIYYLLEDGLILFKCNKDTNEILLRNNDSYTTIICKNIVNSSYSVKHQIALVITSNNKILGYDIRGTSIFETPAPEEYCFLYFSTKNDKLVVIAEKTDGDEDEYGRNRRHFIIDEKSGKLSKSDLAY